jgi:hypothetical protein
MTIFRRISIFCIVSTFVWLHFLNERRIWASEQFDQTGGYLAVSGLIDLRSTFSDGKHTINQIVQLARKKGFRVIFLNDHDRIALSYGLPPFRSILRYKKEFPSISTHGAQNFLEEIDRVSKINPDVIIIPGCETSPHYYWTGSWFTKNLTVHEYDRRMLVINFNTVSDYDHLPYMGNKLSLRYTKKRLPGLLTFLLPIVIGIILLKWKGGLRFMGFGLLLLSGLAIIDYNPFRSSLFTAYKGDQGIAPFQETIDYVKQRDGLIFWNYPEQKSGRRKYGPIYVDTPPYPQVLLESKGYTGFAAIYGDTITITEPGREWDLALNEYCCAKRERPPWGIATADFHEEGGTGEKLGNFPTTFLVKDFSKAAILDAMQKGRMYCSRSVGRAWPKLDFFNVADEKNNKAMMGETVICTSHPVIRFKMSLSSGGFSPVAIHLIRGGRLIYTFKGKTPIQVEYKDEKAPIRKMTFYRLIDSKKHLVSNPIFVTYAPMASSS